MDVRSFACAGGLDLWKPDAARAVERVLTKLELPS
jgi:hypothetical protein